MPHVTATTSLPTLATTLLLSLVTAAARAEDPASPPTTWDGRFPVDTIRATVVYFLPTDREPIPDWLERVEWLCERMRRFHAREFAGRSRLVTRIHPHPFRSALSTGALRAGDADALFFRTMAEVDRAIDVGTDADGAFPVLVVLSDINWRPLDDFSRLVPDGAGWRFDGAIADDGIHVPGAAAGGSRAVYLPDRGRGWGLVSGDGWRVPCRGSDCVVYHEGIGHAIGLPHPDGDDGSVMGFGQYRHALAQSWIDAAQKARLGVTPPGEAPPADPVFDRFVAFPEPAAPRPRERVGLRLEPRDLVPEGISVEVQTDLRSPWMRIPVTPSDVAAGFVPLGSFDRPGGVAWRIDAGRRGDRDDDAPSAATAWGYFQIRVEPGTPPPPGAVDPTDRRDEGPWRSPGDAAATVDLLALVDPARHGVAGSWERSERDGHVELLAPKAYGARIEIPYAPPSAYRLTLVAEPLDEPHGLTVGLRSGGSRFLVLLGFGEGSPRASALENVDGANVAANPTRVEGDVFVRGRPAEIVCTVLRESVRVTVDGKPWIVWEGNPEQLSLGDYWQTPRAEALFLGAYDCRYRFLRVTLETLDGTGRPLDDAVPATE